MKEYWTEVPKIKKICDIRASKKPFYVFKEARGVA